MRHLDAFVSLLWLMEAACVAPFGLIFLRGQALAAFLGVALPICVA